MGNCAANASYVDQVAQDKIVKKLKPTKVSTSSAGRDSFMSISTTGTREPPAFICQSDMEYPESKTSTISSRTHTDSLESGEFSSYDGMNMRATNRYMIGLEILKAKIYHGADPNRMTTHGERTPLMFSVLANDLKFIKLLVKLGVDVNQKNSSGETALGFASELHKRDIASYLRSQGALE